MILPSWTAASLLLLPLLLCAAKEESSEPSYADVVDKVAEDINKASERSREIQDEHMKNVDKDPGSLITKQAMKNLMDSNTFLPQKAGTKSISVESGQGFNGITNYQPSSWKITETMSGASKRSDDSDEEKEPVFTYPLGLGPLLMNQCTERNYSKSSPCYNSKLFDLQNSICLNLMDAAGYMGVGFDGRGYYSPVSRKVSLIQRVCANKATFLGQDVPDIMNVFGIFQTTAETKSFQSVGEYMRYIRNKAGLSNQKGLFTSEASKYSSASSFGVNLGGIGSMIGAGIGAAVGGPAGAMLGATAGGAIGGSIEGGSGSGSGSSSSSSSSTANSNIEQTETSNYKTGSTQNLFAIMYVKVILYELTLDEVKPTDLSLTLLKDYMDLPVSYFSVGAEVKFQNFLLRWGTHFIRSGKFGGQLKVTKTMKTDKTMSSEQFARVAETEFKSMFSTLQSSYSQKSSSWGFLGIGGKSKETSQQSSAKTETNYKSTSEEQNRQSQDASQSEFTQTTVEAEGGTPEIAEALMDFYTPAFKQLFHDWLVSIKDYAKPFEFQLKSVHELFNMNMDKLFPSGTMDFGCVGGGGGKVQIKLENGTGKRFYIDTRVSLNGKTTTEEKIKVYCKYSNRDDFQKAFERKRISLERAIVIYMAEGPFPTSSLELAAGEVGCEFKTVGKMTVDTEIRNAMSFSELIAKPFLLVFDMPQPIPGIATRTAKFKMVHRGSMWYATDPESSEMHLYEGCKLGDKTGKSICFRNLILSYSETDGLFYITHENLKTSKQLMPSLPSWLEGSTLARPKKLHTVSNVLRGVQMNELSVPCNVKWLNSHRLDPHKEENCIHFTAATAGDIFVVFASIPRDHNTWYYLQISPHGIAFYNGFNLENRVIKTGVGVLGDTNLYQSFFVCVIQKKGSVLMQYGKADPESEIGTVYSSYKFPSINKVSTLSYYTFGSGEKPVSLMDIRLTKQMPDKVECLDEDQVKVDGHCVIDCHSECDNCKRAKDNKACQQCKHVRVEQGSGAAIVTECLAECPAGHKLSEAIDNLCIPCAAGYFKNETGNGGCKKCPVGTFSPSGAANCSLCPEGTFVDKEGQVECRSCAAGTFSNTVGTVKCSECAEGSFSSSGMRECELCRVGRYADTKGLAECKLCQPNYFAAAMGQTSCDSCPVGTKSVAGSSSCDNSCKAGQFSPKKGVACSNCKAGTYAESAGSSACSACQPGSYQPAAGGSGCIAAPKGHYVPGSAASSTQKCKAGTYSDKEGQSSSSACKPCSAGSFSAESGAATCTKCPTGQYQPLSAQTRCLTTDAGYYTNVKGMTGQKACWAGSISAAGASTCRQCGKNTVAASAGLSACTPCGGKTWAPVGSSTCHNCPANLDPINYSEVCFQRVPVYSSYCFAQDSGMPCSRATDGVKNNHQCAAATGDTRLHLAISPPRRIRRVVLWSYMNNTYSTNVRIQYEANGVWHSCAQVTSGYSNYIVVKCEADNVGYMEISKLPGGGNRLIMCEVEVFSM